MGIIKNHLTKLARNAVGGALGNAITGALSGGFNNKIAGSAAAPRRDDGGRAGRRARTRAAPPACARPRSRARPIRAKKFLLNESVPRFP